MPLLLAKNTYFFLDFDVNYYMESDEVYTSDFVNHITIQMAFTLPLLLQIFLRALPIAFPAVFYYKLRKDGHEHSADRI